jgi:aminoglycoside phosphotransferase (APT) family kinase protein
MVERATDGTVQPPPVGDTTQQLGDTLALVLADRLGEGVGIEGLRRLTGGASRETWAFDAVDRNGARHPLILRRDFPDEGQPSLASLIGVDNDLDRRGEFALFQALVDAGLPVPRPIALPDDRTGLTDCFVMERIEGEGLPQRLLRDAAYAEARARLPEQLGSLLARVHALGPDDLPPVPERTVDSQIDVARRMVGLGPAPRPVFELALRWLHEGRPRTALRRLVHGDFRNGNFLVGPEGLRAVLDWEYAHIGDPMEDLAFLCLKPWRFGHVAAEVGGFGARESLYRAYERAGSPPVDPEAVRFWEVLSNLKWGALCVARAMAHVLRMQPSVEGAAIGRRVAETEYDILELME